MGNDAQFQPSSQLKLIMVCLGPVFEHIRQFRKGLEIDLFLRKGNEMSR